MYITVDCTLKLKTYSHPNYITYINGERVVLNNRRFMMNAKDLKDLHEKIKLDDIRELKIRTR